MLDFALFHHGLIYPESAQLFKVKNSDKPTVG